MSETKISFETAEEVVDDVCADPSLKAKKSPASQMSAGGPKLEPFTAAVAVATIILGADKLYQAATVVGNGIDRWLNGGDRTRQAIDVVVMKENGDSYKLHFERGTSQKGITETVHGYIAA